MNADDALPLEDQFADLLAAYDEALADGRANTPIPDSFAPPELRTRLRQACACLQRLEQDRLASLLSTPRPPLSPLTGEVRLGRFELRHELGRGGIGIVFLAWDTWLRREVALKVPRLEGFLTSELRRRFLHEARAAAELHHPGIVPVYEAAEAGAVCYLVSAYCPGDNLAQWLSRRTAPVPPREAAAVVLALAESVQYVHERKIWHRDIKPSNILLQPLEKLSADGLTFTPRLTDFGLAKLLEAETQHTPSGAVLGTPAYMAPEQASGQLRDIGPHTDIYALGAVLYELLTGQPPFRGVTSLDILRQATEDEPAPPHRLRSDVPRDLERVCLKCLEKEPRTRYASAGKLAADLRRFLDGQPVEARPPGLLERAQKWCARPERVRSAGMFLFSFGLLFFLWCFGSLAVIALGLIQPPRPAATVRYLLAHIGLFYGPMIWAGWQVLRQSRLALRLGTLAALAFFVRMFVFALLWEHCLGRPHPFDMGGMFENPADRVAADVLFTAMAGILCLYCVIALFVPPANREGPRQGEDNSTLQEKSA